MTDITQRFSTGAPQNLEERFASRAAQMKPSEIRSLFAVASRPEIVSLAGGMPNLSALPMEMMAGVVNELILTNGAEALQYGSGQGHPKLREQICDVMALEGIRANADDIVGGDAAENASISLAIFAGQHGAPRDAVLLNAAAAIAAFEGDLDSDVKKRLTAGLARATKAVDSGAASELLKKWAALTSQILAS